MPVIWWFFSFFFFVSFFRSPVLDFFRLRTIQVVERHHVTGASLPPSSFGHPLSGRPKLFGVSRSQSFESRFEIGPAGGHAFRSADDLSRAIRHGQGTRVKAGRRTEEDRFGNLIQSARRAVLVLVSDGDQSFLRRNRFHTLPRIARDQSVDALPPRVELLQARRIRFALAVKL